MRILLLVLLGVVLLVGAVTYVIRALIKFRPDDDILNP